MTDDEVPTDFAEAPEEAGLLAACPHCRYALRGLPMEHRCPECGLALDRRWQVHGGPLLRNRAPKARRVRRYLHGFFLIYMAGWLVALMLIPLPRYNRMFLLAVIGLGLAALTAAILHQPVRFFALGPRGLEVYQGGKRRDCYAWSDVGRARYDLLRKSLAFAHRGQEVRLKVFSFFGTDIGAVDECVRAINAYPRSV